LVVGQRSDRHAVSRLAFHLVWAIRYRYAVLQLGSKLRCRTLLILICDAVDVEILRGVVSGDQVHMHASFRPSSSADDPVKKLRGRGCRKLPKECPDLKKRYWGRHFQAIGFGCWNTGNITDEMVNEYLEHHRRPDDNGGSNFIIE
jgi:putative transposase